MSRIYPLHRNFIDSTAVARLNGYTGGHGSKKQFESEIDDLGLTDAGRQALRERVIENRRRSGHKERWII